MEIQGHFSILKEREGWSGKAENALLREQFSGGDFMLKQNEKEGSVSKFKSGVESDAKFERPIYYQFDAQSEEKHILLSRDGFRVTHS
jgi:hypothetical protein